MRKYGFFLAAAMILAAALPAHAGVVYNSDVSYWQSGGPTGTIGGSGQVNGGFVVSTNECSGVELGLRASQRYMGMTNVTVIDNTYYVQAGEDINSNNGAWWNMDWSVDLTDSNYNAGDLCYSLSIVENTNRGHFEGTYNLKNWVYFNYNHGADYYQDSQNLNIAPWDQFSDDNSSGFLDFPNWYAGFSPNALGTYDICLTVSGGGCECGFTQSVDMTVIVGGTPPSQPGDPVVPEPATLSLIGIGLAGIGALRRRRRR